MDVRIEHDEEASRFRINAGEEEAGFAEYVRDGDRWVFTHTSVRPQFAGRGLAGRLVEHALTHVVAEGGTIVPTCTYVAGFIQKNPQFQEHAQGMPNE